MSKLFRKTFLLLVLPLAFCGHFKKDQEPPMQITYKSGACFGSCPVFTAELNSNGLALFTGRNFVEFEGNYQAKVTTEEVKNWVDKANEFQFFELNEKYDGPVSDLPERIITITIGDQTHTVLSRFGTPESLRKWEKELTQYLLKEVDWKPMEK